MQIADFKPRDERTGRLPVRPAARSFTLHFAFFILQFALTFHFALLFVSLPSAHAAEVEPQSSLPYEMRPYRVRLLIVGDSSAWPATAPQEVFEESRRAADRCVGAMWQLQVEAGDRQQSISPERVSRLTTQELDERFANQRDEVDVIFIASLTPARPGWRIDVRAWQPEFDVLSEMSAAVVIDSREVPLTIIKLCHAALRPVGVVDEVDGETVRVVLQAGALTPPDAAFALTQPGDTLAPWLAYRNRERRIERMQPIPWTYLSVRESNGARIRCDLHSGLRSPIAGKRRGRIETLAIVVRPTRSESRVELVTQTKPPLSLIAHRIVLKTSSEIPRADAAAGATPESNDRILQTLLTDRRGQVSIPADPAHRIVWLFAYSGKHLLARVPFVPGSVTQTRLEVPDDAVRLEAESNLQILQGQLIDTVAMRNTKFAAIRAAMTKNDLERAASEELELRKLPDAQVFLDRVVGVRVPAVQAAKARKDRSGEIRIHRMCDELSELIRQYLNEDKRRQIREELKELKQERSAVAEETRNQ
jgi:hypothetical protein